MMPVNAMPAASPYRAQGMLGAPPFRSQPMEENTHTTKKTVTGAHRLVMHVPQERRADVTRYTSYTPSTPRTALSTWPRCLGSPISNVNRDVATRSRDVWTAAERMFTCWSDRT